MFTYSYFELAFGLSYILVVTDIASEHIHQVLGSAIAYMVFPIGSMGCVTGEKILFIEDFRYWTISVVTNGFFFNPLGGIDSGYYGW